MMDYENKTFKVILQYMRLQFLFMMRLCKEISPLHIVILFLLTVAVLIYLSSLPSYIPLLVYCALICYYNSQKRDRIFLKIIIGKTYKICYWILYTVISLPFFMVSVLTANYLMACLYPIVAAIVAFLLSSTININFRISHPLLTKEAYEYLRGFRSLSVIYICLLVFSLLGAWAGNMRIPKVLTFLTIYLLNCFYLLDYREEYVLNYSRARDMVVLKLKNIIINNAVCLLPFFVLLVAFEHSMYSFYMCLWYYTISVVTMINSLCFRILFEKPDFITFGIVSAFYAVAVSSVICPIVLPIPVAVSFVLLVSAYYKVKRITRI